MRIRLLLGVLFALSLSTGALAAKKEGGDEPKYPEIKLLNIAEFDPTLTRAKEIHDTLAGVENKLREANKGLSTALKMPETSSLDEMLAELKKRANNKIEVGLEKGRVPKLKATDAVPSDVQAAIDTVNGMMDDLGASLEKVEGLPQQVQGLIGEVKAFPGQLSVDLLKKNNLGATDLPKVTKTLGTDVKAIEATPERIKGVTDQTMGMFQKVQNAFTN